MHTQSPQAGTLYVVATPIGNLADMTPHAVECLKTVDAIACEDTRTSSTLLRHFGIATPTLAYHDHNADSQTERLITRLQNGEHIALISDAGTPLISDPGYRLVKACHQAGIRVSPVVGACAAIAALSVAGLPSDKFYFYGFLPAKSGARQQALQELRTMPATLIFYEAPHRIAECVADMVAVLGDTRAVTLCREISKTFETIHHTDLAGLVEFIAGDSNQTRGEMVLVVAGANLADADQTENAHDELLTRLLADLSVKKAAQLAADLTGAKKNALYQRALLLQALKNA